MASSNTEVVYEFPHLIRVYKTGHVERLQGTDTVPAGTDAQTGVLSKDVSIIPESELYVRLYLPENLTSTDRKLPILVYFHGGAFCTSTPSSPTYHNFLNTVVAEAQIVAVSVHYRRPPEHPLPVAYDDSWDALQWVVSHCNCEGPDEWLNKHADFGRLFLSGDSAGANIAHNLAMAAENADLGLSVPILGVALIDPYFWGTEAIGSESLYPDKKAAVDTMWKFVCPSNPDNDDPRINPLAEGAPSLAGLGCRRVLVCVAEKDILKDRGWLYYQMLGKSGWMGVAEIHETEGEEHVFHLHNLQSENAQGLIRRLAAFFNRDMPPLV